MKSAAAILFCVVFASLCLFACSNNLPKEPASTKVETFSYVNPYGQTVAPPPTDKTEPDDKPKPVQYVETINNLECVLSDYYVYGNTVGEIIDIAFSGDDGISVNADGFADIKIKEIGSRKKGFKIGYAAYDANGKLVRKSYLLANLKNVKKGDVVKACRLDFPRNAVKIVFVNYTE